MLLLKRFVKTKDFVASVFFYSLAMYIFITARQFPVRPNIPHPQNPGFYPMLLAIILLILTTINLIQVIIKLNKKMKAEQEGKLDPQQEIKESFWGNSNPRTRTYLGISVLIMGLYIPIFNWLGFATSTFFLVFIISRILSPKEAKTLKILMISVVATVIIYLIFDVFIGIRFPQGLLI